MPRPSKRELENELEELKAATETGAQDVEELTAEEKEIIGLLCRGEPYGAPSYTDEEEAAIREHFDVEPEAFPELRQEIIEELHEQEGWR